MSTAAGIASPLPGPVAVPARRPQLRRCVAVGHTVRVAAADGVELVGTQFGDPCAQRTVVFLHGFCLSETSWSAQARAVAARYGGRVRVISYDHRGHGRSGPASRSGCRIEQLADDLARVLTALQVGGRVVFVAHSMGAMVALAYLGRQQRPVDPADLVLVGAAAGRLTDRGLGRLLTNPAVSFACRIGRYAPALAVQALAAPLCAGLGQWPARGPGGQRALIEVIVHAAATTPAATVFGFLPEFARYDKYRVLGSIRARTVVVSGECDMLTPPSHGVELAAGIQGAQHIRVAGVRHMLPQQAHRVIHEVLGRILGKGIR